MASIDHATRSNKKGIIRSRSGIITINPWQPRRYLHPRAQNVAHTLSNRTPMPLIQLHLSSNQNDPSRMSQSAALLPSQRDQIGHRKQTKGIVYSIDRRGVGVSPGTQPGRAG